MQLALFNVLVAACAAFEAGRAVSKLEVVVVQEATKTFATKFPTFQSVLSQQWRSFSEIHSNVSMGVLTFRDRPVTPFGDEGDYCVRIEHQLSTNLTAAASSYSHFTATGGGDWMNAQLTALAAATQMRWSVSLELDSLIRLIVLITATPAHSATDEMNTQRLPRFSGVFDNDLQCVEEYYPSAEQVVEAVKARDAYLAVFVRDTEGDVLSSWQYFNQLLGQPSSFVLPLNIHTIHSDMLAILTTIRDLESEATSPPDWSIIPAPIQTPPVTTTATRVSTLTTRVPAPMTTGVSTVPTSAPISLPSTAPCGGVDIKLRDRPDRLQLDIDY